MADGLVSLIRYVCQMPWAVSTEIVAVPVREPILTPALNLRLAVDTVRVRTPLATPTAPVPFKVNPVEQTVNTYWPVTELNCNRSPFELSFRHWSKSVSTAAVVVAVPHPFVNTARNSSPDCDGVGVKV